MMRLASTASARRAIASPRGRRRPCRAPGRRRAVTPGIAAGGEVARLRDPPRGDHRHPASRQRGGGVTFGPRAVPSRRCRCRSARRRRGGSAGRARAPSSRPRRVQPSMATRHRGRRPRERSARRRARAAAQHGRARARARAEHRQRAPPSASASAGVAEAAADLDRHATAAAIMPRRAPWRGAPRERAVEVDDVQARRAPRLPAPGHRTGSSPKTVRARVALDEAHAAAARRSIAGMSIAPGARGGAAAQRAKFSRRRSPSAGSSRGGTGWRRRCRGRPRPGSVTP